MPRYAPSSLLGTHGWGQCAEHLTPTLLRWTLFVLGQLPLPLLHGLGWLLGSLLWLVPNGLRAVTRRHLELCFPERSPAERARIGRLSLIESAKAVCEAP